MAGTLTIAKRYRRSLKKPALLMKENENDRGTE
jgi:hypothetical protein